jgi:FkbM family methyltransferase
MTKFDYRGRTYVIAGYDERDYIFKRIQEEQTFFEQATLEFIAKRRLRGTYLDIGANIGNHALFFLTQTECEQLIAVEGNADVIPILKSNLARNLPAGGNYTVVEDFLSNDAQVFFNRDRTGNVGSSFLTRVQLGLDSHPVSARRLDEIVDANMKVSYLKLDVEGHELEVLKSGSALLRSDRPEICVEVISTAPDEITSYLRSFGYLPLTAFPEGNLYYVTFPRWVIVLMQAFATLPDFVYTRIAWRFVRIFAILTRRLSPSFYGSHIPSYPRATAA